MTIEPRIFDTDYLQGSTPVSLAVDVLVWLRNSLLVNDLTQNDLANRLDLDASAVSRIVSGERKLSAVELLQARELFERVGGPICQGVVPENDTPDTLQPGQSIPLRRPMTFGDLAAEGIFEEALETYAEAITAHRKLLTKVTAEAVALARQSVIEAHLAGAQTRAAGLAEAMQAWNVNPGPIRVWTPDDEREMAATMPLPVRLKRTLTTLINDDVSEPGSEARARFVERCTTLLDAIDAVEGRPA